MIDPEEYKRLAVEFTKAMVVQVQVEALATMEHGWERFCRDVFDLTDAFVDGVEQRLAERQSAYDDAFREVPIRTSEDQR